MSKYIILIIISLFFPGNSAFTQEDDLEALLEAEMDEKKEEVLGTFLSTYVLNNQSVELLDKNGLNFRISHKFGFLNSGPENFYGFDNSSVFMGVEYAPIDRINIGLGRGTFRESINAMLKINVLKQSTGSGSMPFSLVLYTEVDYKTKKYLNADLQNNRMGRLDYTTQLLLARKFGSYFALQLMPGYTHRNLVEKSDDLNGIASLGFGGTYRLYKSLRLNAEYFWVQNHNSSLEEYHSPLSLGICYQTSRHAFELFATNSTGITSNNHIAYTTGDFWSGDICIGFNVSIIFSVKR